MFDLISEGVIEIQIAASYPLHGIQRADAELGKRHTRGKIVLIPSADPTASMPVCDRTKGRPRDLNP